MKAERKKYGTQELKPKIGHKISSTKLKARKRDVAKTNRLGVAGNSIAEEIGNG